MTGNATVHCRCGAASVETAAPIRLSLWCACCDCRQKVTWSLANDRSPSTESSVIPPVQRAVYFENAIARTEGNLQPTLLRDGGRSTFLVATCCSSVLAISHPAYAGKVFMVIEAAARIEGSVPEPLARIYLKDHSVEDRGPLPPVECPSFRSDDADIDEARKVYRPVFARPIAAAAASNGTNELYTLEELMSRLPPTNVLGLQEGASVVRSSVRQRG